MSPFEQSSDFELAAIFSLSLAFALAQIWLLRFLTACWDGTIWDRATAQKVIRSLEYLGPRWLKSYKCIVTVLPFTTLMLSTMLVTAVIAAVLEVDLDVLVYSFFAVVMFGGFLMVLIWFFNRPKFLVPPYMHEYKGFFGDWAREVVKKTR